MPQTRLRTVTLGSGDTTLEVSALGLGCMGMSFAYGKGDDEQSLTVLARALELGLTFFDTADMCGVGHNEALIGRWLPSVRDQVVIATKFGNPGTKRIAHLEENLGALDVSLDADDLAAIEAVAPKGGFEGDRYPDMRFVGSATPALEA